MSVIIESERKTPIAMRVDVAVVGGGPAGIIAALAARRVGAGALLIERHGHLGGLLTGGFVTKPQAPVVGGIPEELFERTAKLGGAQGNLRYRLRDGTYTYWIHLLRSEHERADALQGNTH